MSNRIEAIRLKSCRGATKDVTIPLDAKKPLVLLFGENGTGKSTIVDAIDMVCNQRCGSIDGRSSANVSEHAPSIGKLDTDLQASITVDKKTWTAKLKGSKLSVTGPDTTPVAHLLRRNQLLKLVEAAPADRYKEVARFVDVTTIDAREQTLKDAARIANERVDREIELRDESALALRKLWEGEGCPGGSASSEFRWAADRIAVNISTLESHLVWLNLARTSIELARSALANRKTSKENSDNAHEALRLVNVEVSGSPGLSATQGIDIVNLLQRAQTYIGEHLDDSSCPVCGQPVAAVELSAAIGERLSALDDYIQLAQKRLDAEKLVTTSERILGRDDQSLAMCARTLAELLVQGAQDLEAALPSAKESLIGLSQRIISTDDDVTSMAETLILQLNAGQDALIAHLETTARDIAQHNAVKQAHKRVTEGDESIKIADATNKGLEAALKIVRDARQAHVNTVLDSVTGECKRMYEAIHPGESLNIENLRLDERFKGSLLQHATFEGVAHVPPQAYFSDAHLDTLGFCFWLSIMKLQSPMSSIIVIDDVFTSVDAAHVRRIIDLLTTESDAFAQIIVSTHYRAWLDTHKYQQTASSKAHVIELSRWTIERGISHHRSKLAIQDLEDKIALEPIDRQSLCSAAGVLLEQILDHLTLQYRSGVPRTRDGDYTLGDLINASFKLTRKLTLRRSKRDAAGKLLSPSEEEQISVIESVDALKDMAFIRNEVGCHFNPKGAEITDRDVEEFAQRTLELASAIVCRGCGEVSRWNRGTHFECHCGDLKLEPLMFQ